MKYTLTLFILVSLAQLYAPAQMIFQRESVLKNGKEFKFKTQPIDPTDPFRGAYIWLNFQENSFKTDTTHIWRRGQTVFVHLEDSAGFAKIAGWSTIRPESGDYLKATVDYFSHYNNRDSMTIHINYPFDRFYMDEEKSKPAENVYFDSLSDSTKTTYAKVQILKGRAVLKDVMINDKSIRELVSGAK